VQPSGRDVAAEGEVEAVPEGEPPEGERVVRREGRRGGGRRGDPSDPRAGKVGAPVSSALTGGVE